MENSYDKHIEAFPIFFLFRLGPFVNKNVCSCEKLRSVHVLNCYSQGTVALPLLNCDSKLLSLQRRSAALEDCNGVGLNWYESIDLRVKQKNSESWTWIDLSSYDENLLEKNVPYNWKRKPCPHSVTNFNNFLTKKRTHVVNSIILC